MLRRLIWVAILFVSISLFLLLSHPYWLPLAIAPALRKAGVEVESVERGPGYRFLLHSLSYRTETFELKVETIRFRQPVSWWRLLRSSPRNSRNPKLAPVFAGDDFFEIKGWSLVWFGTEMEIDDPGEPGPWSWSSLAQILETTTGHLARWLPTATLVDGTIEGAGQKLKIGEVTWRYPSLHIFAEYEEHPGALLLEFDVQEADRSISIALQTGDLWPDFTGQFQLESPVLLSGYVVWNEQEAPVRVLWEDADPLPVRWSLHAHEWRIPGDLLRLEEYADHVTTRFQLEGEGLSFSLEGSFLGQATDADWPNLEGKLRLSGDPGQINFDLVEWTLPGLRANLATPVSFDFKERTLSEATAFLIEGQIDEMPWLRNFEVKGTVIGTMTVTPSTDWPKAVFQIEATGLQWQDLSVSMANIGGAFEWPLLSIDNLRLTMGDRSGLQGRAILDLDRTYLQELEVSWQEDPSFLQAWLPETLKLGDFQVSLSARGPLESLQYTGSFLIDEVSHPALQKTSLQLEWTGEQLSHLTFGLEAQFQEKQGFLQASGSITQRQDGWEGVVAKIGLQQGGQDLLESVEPWKWWWHPNDEGSFDLRMEGLRMRGEVGYLRLDTEMAWPDHGQVRGEASINHLAWIQTFLQRDFPSWQEIRFDLDGGWNSEGMKGTLDMGMIVPLPGEENLMLEFLASMEPGVFSIEAMHVGSGLGPVFRAEGLIPLTLLPGDPSEPVRFSYTAPISFQAEFEKNDAFWREVSTILGLEISEPSGRIELSGTLERPSARLDLALDRLRLDLEEDTQRLPLFEDMQVVATIRDGSIEAGLVSARLAGQDLEAEGKLPLPDDFWPALYAGTPSWPDWRDADLRVVMREADVAAFAAYIPEILTPSGTLDVQMRLTPGGQWNGQLRFSEVATRPILPFGALQEMSGRLVLEGERASLDEFTAFIAGEPVRLSGWLERVPGGPPRLDFQLRGQRIALVRQAGLLLRSDLDIRLRSGETGIVTVSGDVRLRDGLFLLDSRGLIPQGTRSPQQRPPFFAVDVAPFSDWVLDVRVRGDDFLRVQTPFFTGRVGTRLQLREKLSEPQAIGQVTLSEGVIQFPFAAFSLQTGQINLTLEDPYEPQLNIFGTTRRFGYDLQVEVTGPASSPRVVFASSPSLASDEILLMVMAGEVPRDDFEITGQQRASRLGMYLGRSLFSGFGGSEGGLGDRVTIDSGESISRAGRETYRIEIELTDQLYLQGEFDEFDAYNAGIVWRFTSSDQRRQRRERREEP